MNTLPPIKPTAPAVTLSQNNNVDLGGGGFSGAASAATTAAPPVQSANGSGPIAGVGSVPAEGSTGWGQYVHDLWNQIFNGSASSAPGPVAPAPAAPGQGVDGSGVRGQETFSDAWGSNPTQGAPVRTWVDPTARTGPNGEFISAWNDQPAAATQANAAPVSYAPAAPAGVPPASALTGLISTLQTAAPVAAAPAPTEPNWHNPDIDSSGGSGGGSGGGD